VNQTDSTADSQLNEKHTVTASKMLQTVTQTETTAHTLYTVLYCQLNQTDSAVGSEA